MYLPQTKVIRWNIQMKFKIRFCRLHILIVNRIDINLDQTSLTILESLLKALSNLLWIICPWVFITAAGYKLAALSLASILCLHNIIQVAHLIIMSSREYGNLKSGIWAVVMETLIIRLVHNFLLAKCK